MFGIKEKFGGALKAGGVGELFAARNGGRWQFLLFFGKPAGFVFLI